MSTTKINLLLKKKKKQKQNKIVTLTHIDNR